MSRNTLLGRCLVFVFFQLASTTTESSKFSDLNKNFQFQTFAQTAKYDATTQRDGGSPEFDVNLLDELNMWRTFQNVYKSCFRDESSAFHDALHTVKNAQFSNNNRNKASKRKIMGDILVSFLDKAISKLPLEALDMIDYVCENPLSPSSKYRISPDDDNSKRDLFNKLTLLSQFEHDLCGNIYKNSIPTSLLRNQVLGMTSRRANADDDVSDDTISNQIVKNDALFEPSSSTYEYKQMLWSNSTSSSAAEAAESELNDNTIGTASDPALLANASTTTPRIARINNCTLILLNVYLQALRSRCHYDSFIESLNHYDCLSNNFSVQSDCSKCKVGFKHQC